MCNSLSLALKNKVATIFLSLFIACPLAQTTPEQRLAHAYALEREGKPAEAIWSAPRSRADKDKCGAAVERRVRPPV